MKIFRQDHDLKGLFLRHRTFVAAAFVMTLGALLGVSGIWFALSGLQTRASANSLAIEKGCVLLNNKILESQGTGSKSTGLLIGEILKLANKHGDKKLVIEYQTLASKQKLPVLKTIDCKSVARHPEEIKAIQVKSPAPRKKP